MMNHLFGKKSAQRPLYNQILKNSQGKNMRALSMSARTPLMVKLIRIHKVISSKYAEIGRLSTHFTTNFQALNKSNVLLTLLVGLAYLRWICLIMINI